MPTRCTARLKTLVPGWPARVRPSGLRLEGWRRATRRPILRRIIGLGSATRTRHPLHASAAHEVIWAGEAPGARRGH